MDHELRKISDNVDNGFGCLMAFTGGIFFCAVTITVYLLFVVGPALKQIGKSLETISKPFEEMNK